MFIVVKIERCVFYSCSILSDYALLMQCCEAPGVCKYNVFISVVDYRVLLGYCWWPRCNKRFTSVILVCFRDFCFDVISFVSLYVTCVVTCLMFYLQALYYVSGFRCDLCNNLCCCRMSNWYRHLLLPSMYNWNLICHDRTGIWHFSDPLVAYS